MRRLAPATRKCVMALLVSVFLWLPTLLAQQPTTPPAHPKVVVIIVVDQMRSDYIERFRDRWHGGLRRLVDQGAWFRNAAYPYAETETCPSHATIATGVFPATHGIIGNAWWDRQTATLVTCTGDLTRIGGVSSTPAAFLQAPTFGEQLMDALPGSSVTAMSLKARSAMMLGGHKPNALLWQDETNGELKFSTAFRALSPFFPSQFVQAHPLAADFSKVWDLAAPVVSYTGGRSVLGEGPSPGWTTSFPHPLSVGEEKPGAAFFQRWRASPFADAWLGGLAAAALGEGPGPNDRIGFFAISFSATDYIGHAFGPDSREIEDDMLQLDLTIGALLDKLDRAVGAGQYVVALTADHGVATVPEQARAQGRDAGRVNSASLIARIEKALELTRRFGSGRHVAQLVGSDLYLAPGIASQMDSDPSLWRVLQRAILAEPGVDRVIRRTRQVPGSAKDPLTRALSLDFFPERSGDVWINLKRNWIFSARTATGWAGGTTHGTSYDYDQRVPIILFGSGIKPGQYTVSATPADIAPTLASLSEIRIARTDGRILTEALAPRPAQAASRPSQGGPAR